MEVVYNTQDIISKKYSQKFSTILALWGHPQKRTFENFEQIFADFRLLDHYNIKIILANCVEIVHSIQVITSK